MKKFDKVKTLTEALKSAAWKLTTACNIIEDAQTKIKIMDMRTDIIYILQKYE